MDDVAHSLYDEDFYAWTQQQAELLRRGGAGANSLDIEHIAEEIEDLGKSELHACQSLCEHIIEHLLKLEYSGLAEPARHWQREIVEWRLQLEKKLTRSILAKFDLGERYRYAVRVPSGKITMARPSLAASRASASMRRRAPAPPRRSIAIEPARAAYQP